MTHRDRVGDPPGRRGAAGDAGHRQGFPTPSGGSPRRPERRLPKAFGRRRLRLAMPRIATPRAPGRKPWEAVSMSHYQRSLVSLEELCEAPFRPKTRLKKAGYATRFSDGSFPVFYTRVAC